MEVHVSQSLRRRGKLSIESYENVLRPGTYMACARDERGWMKARTYGHPSAESAEQAIIGELGKVR